MHIRNFTDKDIIKASKLAKLTWGDFYIQESEELQNLIYSFMVKYYDLNREYSFSILDDELKAFLLAFGKTDCYKPKDFDKLVKVLKNEDGLNPSFKNLPSGTQDSNLGNYEKCRVI